MTVIMHRYHRHRRMNPFRLNFRPRPKPFSLRQCSLISSGVHRWCQRRERIQFFQQAAIAQIQVRHSRITSLRRHPLPTSVSSSDQGYSSSKRQWSVLLVGEVRSRPSDVILSLLNQHSSRLFTFEFVFVRSRSVSVADDFHADALSATVSNGHSEQSRWVMDDGWRSSIFSFQHWSASVPPNRRWSPLPREVHRVARRSASPPCRRAISPPCGKFASRDPTRLRSPSINRWPTAVEELFISQSGHRPVPHHAVEPHLYVERNPACLSISLL